MGLLISILLLAAGVFFTLRTRFIQVRGFLRSVKLFIAGDGPRGEAGVSPFQAAATALGATIGTGNIAGVAGAILLGGPGAVFWMWISAFFGMALKYAEIAVALRYRKRGADGEWRGGPMNCIEQGLPRRFHFLAPVYAICAAAGALGMGNLVQANTVAISVLTVARTVTEPDGRLTLVITAATGLALSALLACGMYGGARRTGRISAILVPCMSALYVLGALAVVCKNGAAVPQAFRSIFESAFSPAAALGGAAGAALRRTVRVGVVRGVFTHEAGLGTSALAHASADVRDSHDQSLFGVFEVFFDTLFLCTITALVILCSGVPLAYGSDAEAASLTIYAFSTFLGGRLSAVFLALSLFLFAFSSMLAFALYGARCMEYLFGPRSASLYRVVFLLCVIPGAVMRLSSAWRVAETLNYMMAVPNLIALFLLSDKMKKAP